MDKAMASTKRPLAMLAAVALCAGFLMVASAPNATACAPLTRKDVFKGLRAGTMETVSLRLLHMDLKFPKAVAIGNVATIKATVTRPAKEDPAGNGIPMERPYTQPAEDVIVGIGLSIGRVFLPGAGITDAEGKTTVKITIEEWAPAGKTVHASAYAWRVVQSTPCLTVQEDGYTARPDAFRTKP